MSDTPANPEPDHATLLRNAYAMRAAAYAHMFDVLRERFGEAIALEVGAESTRRLGESMGVKFRGFGPADLTGLCAAFLDGIPNRDAMFAPEILRCDGERLEIQFHRCPLKEAWEAQGRSPEDVALLCRMAGAIDGGLFETAGFTFKGTTWTPGREGCCRLVVEPGPAQS
ncbi:L-2-amino-thiazoline-4-carboxylic acid hydrolase [Azospirillum halopraeferens]|uniref:L-2-amino-thiazoline-4-carboxylic acid hydrolase n=1 Tax=Azospirillum halopraeferens TaxID=34010 RepID=UPI0004236A72|nr:L-2-amino-thiazoline-4-carboxylic acid hydrolase [Azospirillum halopraeferens]